MNLYIAIRTYYAAANVFHRIDESLCRVDDTVETEDSPIGYDRCDTRATEAGEIIATNNGIFGFFLSEQNLQIFSNPSRTF